MMASQPAPTEVFCSYAHEDESWLRKLEKHLSVLRRQGLISLWHDRLITAGTNWEHIIDAHLEGASVILLLVSADFFASDYCYGVEMKRALERHEANEARVIPIVVRPVEWKDTPLAHLQALPTDAKPLSTWRNKDAALATVVAGIRRALEDFSFLTASASRAALPPIWNIPYPRNPFFLGREDDLVRIRRSLHADQAIALSQPQAISGLGGIGKTQLALEYAYQYHREYQAVLWARAESAETLYASFVAMATLLQLPEREEKDQQAIVEAVRRWLQIHQNWLLILDNADELALLHSFLPSTLPGHLLLTSRATALGRLAHRIEIESFSPQHGALLLLRRSGLLPPDVPLEEAAPEEYTLAIQIAEELGGLPLALDQAGAYLEETGTHLATYWQLYQQYRAELLRERRGLVADHPLPVAATWSVSFQRVQERNVVAAELLRLFAWLPADAIAEEFLTKGAAFLGPVLTPLDNQGMELNRAIEVLRAYSLVRRDPRRQMLSIHRLVQAVLQDQQDQAEHRMWATRVVQATNAAFPHAEYETWAQCERLLPLALLAVDHIKQEQMSSQEAGRLFYETASYLQSRARYAEAEPLLQCVLQIREEQLGPEHPDVAYPLNVLGNLYKEQGKYAEAEPLYQRALHIWEKQLGPEHLNVATALNNLATLYFEQGKYIEAEVFFQHTLQIREQQLGSEHSLLAAALNNLGSTYKEQGKYAEAEPLYQRALHIWEKQLGPEHSLMAAALNNLGGNYTNQGKYAEAEPLYQRALHIWEKQLGPEHPHVAHPLNNLAELYTKQSKYAEAEPLYQRALHIWEKQEHPNTAEALFGLAVIQERQGNHQEALALYQRALIIREQVFGQEHPKTKEARMRLTSLSQTLSQEVTAPLQDDIQTE